MSKKELEDLMWKIVAAKRQLEQIELEIYTLVKLELKRQGEADGSDLCP